MMIDRNSGGLGSPVDCRSGGIVIRCFMIATLFRIEGPNHHDYVMDDVTI